MRLAIDVNRYSDFTRDVPGVEETLERADRIYVPFVVLAELRSGFRAGTQSAANEAVLTRFLQKPGASVLFPDEQTIHWYSEVYIQLRRAGRPIPTNDIWIAALVIQHGLILFSRDKHFDAVPQIPRL